MTGLLHQMRLAPMAAFIAIAFGLFAAVFALDSFRGWQAEQVEADWAPFSWHEIEASQDGEVLYFTLNGYKATTLALRAQVHAFIIGGTTHVVACYRPDGTVCVPNPIVSAATEFHSPTLRVLIPPNVLSDTEARFRVCYTYDSRTWCDSIPVSEIERRSNGNVTNDGFEIIVPALSGEPRQIQALP